MPELPEVEVTRLGIAPHLLGCRITAVKVIDGRLRWPVPHNLPKILLNQQVRSIERRGKYLLVELDLGHLLLHLGRTGGGQGGVEEVEGRWEEERERSGGGRGKVGLG